MNVLFTKKGGVNIQGRLYIIWWHFNSTRVPHQCLPYSPFNGIPCLSHICLKALIFSFIECLDNISLDYYRRVESWTDICVFHRCASQDNDCVLLVFFWYQDPNGCSCVWVSEWANEWLCKCVCMLHYNLIRQNSFIKRARKKPLLFFYRIKR